jgi:hypothetical protein
MKNITLAEVLSNDIESFSKKIETDYEYYTKLIKMLSFKNLMNEFRNYAWNSYHIFPSNF